METSYLKDMMVMETSLLNNIKDLITSLLMLNLIGIFLMMIMESVKRMSMRMKRKLILRKVGEQMRMIASFENTRVLKKSKKKRISLEHPCTWTSILGRNHTMEVQEQGENVGKEPSLCHEDSSLSPFVNPSLLSDEVSFEELKLLLESYISHVSIIGDACSISFCGGLFLVCLIFLNVSSHASLTNHRCIMVLNSILLAMVLGY
ncbi:hypothetical protein M9H77_16741 [Catharanthus roseus]|uniref:Uncharacterized protein n=1 Tax=Catharanthus roseus TaxID=4058 RepID=A0ACC0B2L7_CATRO|nr:hypothetical protein M9H77_16741 [Catharanthus roseus]